MLESKIQSKIVKRLKDYGYAVNTMQAPPGWPDIRAFKDGRCLLIEVKQLGKTLTPLQKAVHEIFQGKHGTPVHVLTSEKELQKIQLW